MTAPYYSDEFVSLYHGDCQELLPALGAFYDAAVTDPPYAETSLEWDRWPVGWPALVSEYTNSLWCFGSFRMFLDRQCDFGGWTLAQDVIWEKNVGSAFATDRFMRVHEMAAHWYRGPWGEIHHETPRVGHRGPDKSGRRRATGKGHHGVRGASEYVDDGTRLMRSVIYADNLHGRNLHPTEKPIGVILPLVEYACPRGGVVLDPFAGSGTTLRAAKDTGRRAIGVEINEAYCEIAARRLAQDVLDFGGAA